MPAALKIFANEVTRGCASRYLVCVISIFLLLACGRQKHSENGLEFRDWLVVKPVVAGAGTVAYGTIRNTSATPRTLQKVELACAESAELHETVTTGDRARMLSLGTPVIAPGETLVFAPGAKHIMVMRTQKDVGETCNAVFTVDASAARFAIPVRPREN